MKEIELTQGKNAIIDDDDFDFLNRFSWQYCNGNVSTNFKLSSGRWVRIPMNRFLYKPKIQYRIIFINKNPLDNRKSNLKLVTTSQFNGTSSKMYLTNAVRGKTRRNPSSKYKGVSKIKDKRYKFKKWSATVQFKGEVYNKLFATEDEAGLWYNNKAKELFGELSYQNKII
jgi:hypothetical protein